MKRLAENIIGTAIFVAYALYATWLILRHPKHFDAMQEDELYG